MQQVERRIKKEKHHTELTVSDMAEDILALYSKQSTITQNNDKNVMDRLGWVITPVSTMTISDIESIAAAAALRSHNVTERDRVITVLKKAVKTYRHKYLGTVKPAARHKALAPVLLQKEDTPDTAEPSVDSCGTKPSPETTYLSEAIHRTVEQMNQAGDGVRGTHLYNKLDRHLDTLLDKEKRLLPEMG